MNSSNEKTLEKSLKILRRLHFKPENIMVTGSLALDIHGILPDNRISHDADFFVKMSADDWKCMKLIAAVYGKENDYSCKDEQVSFTINDTTLNIWKNFPYENTRVKDKSGIWVSPVENILAAKKGYGRKKDLDDIIAISKKVLG